MDPGRENSIHGVRILGREDPGKEDPGFREGFRIQEQIQSRFREGFRIQGQILESREGGYIDRDIPITIR